MYRKLNNKTATERAQRFMFQDVYIPLDNLGAFITEYSRQDDIQIYPMWLCPVKFNGSQCFGNSYNNPGQQYEYYVDVGIYGEPCMDHYHPTNTNLKLEQFKISCHNFTRYTVFQYLRRVQ